MLVKKRDGRVESFKSDKILASIKKAALAVEVKDDDIQRRAAELKSLKNQLIEHGFDEIEAEEQAEEQFEGYLDDGVYTEYDEEEAEEVVDMVLEGIDSLGLDEDDLIDTGLIQDFVEKALLTTGHVKTAKEYIIKRANRERIREMNTSLMKSYEDLTFGKSSEVETKRENANIDGDSSMGTMLKYGSEGAKKFNLLYVVPPEESEAHSNGDIHIHDLDFYSLTETCVVGSTRLTVRDKNGEVRCVKASDFEAYLADKPVDTVVELSGLEILSGKEFVRIINCVKHSSKNKTVLKIATKSGYIEVTSDHTVPIIRNDTKLEVKASEILIGDKLVSGGCFGVGSLSKLNLINLFGANDRIIIFNSDYVLQSIKEQGAWKKFCQSIGYTGRASSIRNGSTRLTLKDYFEYVIPSGANIDSSALKLAFRRSRSDIYIDAVIDIDKSLGKFIGYMLSEGSVTEHESVKQEAPERHACFVNFDERLIEDFNSAAIKVLNNYKPVTRYIGDKEAGTILPGYLVYELFHGPFGTKNNTGDISIPDWIYSANKEFLSALLGSLIDGDGTVQSDGYRIMYASASKKLINEIQLLLKINGIGSSIRTDRNAGTIADFGDKQSVRKYDTHYLSITSDRYKMQDIDSFKLSEKLNTTKSDNKTLHDAVISIEVVEYNDSVYDFETEDHHFNANGFVVHNCCQIDLEKLFHNGFNTGHGFLREPGEIRSYGALACIAIQSNQNDMHKSVA